MSRRKWFPTAEETVETDEYRYVLGLYNHARYGSKCFRISKFVKATGYFVGHFVVIPEDQETLLPFIADLITLALEKN